MKYPLYSYRDVKVGFMPPQADQSDQAAIRGFSFAVNGKDGIMGFQPGDFALYRVGEFDTDTGAIISCVPVMLCDGISCFGVDSK